MNWPDTPQPPDVLARMAAFIAPAPSMADTCERVAAEFRRLAQRAYDDGDQGRGDRLFTKALTWEMVRDTEDLTLLRERP